MNSQLKGAMRDGWGVIDQDTNEPYILIGLGSIDQEKNIIQITPNGTLIKEH